MSFFDSYFVYEFRYRETRYFYSMLKEKAYTYGRHARLLIIEIRSLVEDEISYLTLVLNHLGNEVLFVRTNFAHIY